MHTSKYIKRKFSSLYFRNLITDLFSINLFILKQILVLQNQRSESRNALEQIHQSFDKQRTLCFSINVKKEQKNVVSNCSMTINYFNMILQQYLN